MLLQPGYTMPGVFVETESIPFEAARLRGERLLVLAPHPDDEVIGCGGLIAQHLSEGRQVRVVIATDGADAGDRETREAESLRGIARLGGNPEVGFLRFTDRTLGDTLAEPLREILRAFKPDLILVTSPIEIHPDHFALARVFCELIQSDDMLFGEMATTRVAFYEVGQPIRPNAIVDITDVAESKYAAIREHASQIAVRDYVGFARGLNAFRTMTLPPGTEFAEAYYVIPLPELHTTPVSELRARIGSAPEIEVDSSPVPISVVIRTKDRPELLLEAIRSVRATGYPCEIVVVNDGGATPEVPSDVRLVTHEASLGRSEAANAGVREASNRWICFLDDDDLFYPEHLSTLANATGSGNHVAWYTDAVSSFLRIGPLGTWEVRSRLRQHATDFNRELLLLDNYIPLPTLLIERETFLELGGFDPTFDLFEDWDFLVRLSQRGSFLRIPKITCEVRHFEGSTSVILAAPEGSRRFREAKLQLWRKHAAEIDNDTFADVLEQQKKRIGTLYSSAIESAGALDRSQSDLDRSIREQIEAQNTINGYALTVRELNGRIESQSEQLSEAMRVAALDRERAERTAVENERLRHELDALRHAHEETHQALESTRVEIARLNGLLEMIYRSKSWKLHTLIEKVRGRG